jgi:hypothetical protein
MACSYLLDAKENGDVDGSIYLGVALQDMRP